MNVADIILGTVFILIGIVGATHYWGLIKTDRKIRKMLEDTP